MGPNDHEYLRPQDPHRRREAGRRRLALVLFLVAMAVVVILAVVLSGNRGASDSTSTTQGQPSASSSTSASTTGSGETTGSSTPTAPQAVTYTADLGGGNEIPPVTTAAGGTLTLTVAADGSSVDYVLELTSIISPTVARLHEGETGATGPTIFTIYGGPVKSGLYSGTIAKGSFTADDLVGPLKGKTIDDLVGMIEANSVYLNVGTETNHTGEIRGQVQ
jgi:CHRD domain